MKRKILAIGFVISLVFSYCLSGLQQPPAQAEESTTTDYDQQIRQAEEEKKKAESRLESLEKDLKELEDSKGDILKYIKKVDKKVLASNAFVLLTSDYFRFSKIQCALFKGMDRDIFIDKKEYSGPLYEQIEAAYQFVLRHINQSVEIDGLIRKERYEARYVR